MKYTQKDNAVLRDGEVVQTFDTPEEAKEALKKIEEGQKQKESK